VFWHKTGAFTGRRNLPTQTGHLKDGMTKQKEKKTKKKCPKLLTRSQPTPAAFLPENKKKIFFGGLLFKFGTY
jgi:hypothetical protein